jgi:long-chain acyl-CoA synthetase
VVRVPSPWEEVVDDLQLTESYWPADSTEPVLETTCGGVLRSAAERAPDAVAVLAGVPDPAARRRVSYAVLLTEAERAARALLGRFAPGERVAVWAPNIPQWIVLQFGAALAGVTLVTVNPLYRAQELRHVLSQSRAAGIFLVPAVRGVSTVDMLDEVRPQLPALRESVLFTDWAAFCASGSPTESLPKVDPGDPAQIQYTSGTTGFPKGAIIHHRGFTNNARYVAAQLQLAPGEVLVNPMPLFHTAGSGCCTLGPMQVQATQVLMPFFDPALLLALNESERSAILAGSRPCCLPRSTIRTSPAGICRRCGWHSPAARSRQPTSSAGYERYWVSRLRSSTRRPKPRQSSLAPGPATGPRTRPRRSGGRSRRPK